MFLKDGSIQSEALPSWSSVTETLRVCAGLDLRYAGRKEEGEVWPRWSQKLEWCQRSLKGLALFVPHFSVNVFRMSKCMGNLQAEEDGPRTEKGCFGDILTMGMTVDS